uniref:Uncharacterized protein n=1 Tax=Mycena chlorophos TaxID=658473 RepID=A0ABQ0LXR2_MYCCL|nr:predicted protein [Mycena chlorophos]
MALRTPFPDTHPSPEQPVCEEEAAEAVLVLDALEVVVEDVESLNRTLETLGMTPPPPTALRTSFPETHSSPVHAAELGTALELEDTEVEELEVEVVDEEVV